MNIYFLKGAEDKLAKYENESDAIKEIREEITKIFDTKNLSFLLGSGCSSFLNADQEEIGIPTMKFLCTEFYNIGNTGTIDNILTKDDKDWLHEELKIDISQDCLSNNLERFLEVLYSLHFYHCYISSDILKATAERTAQIIEKTKLYILKKVLNEDNQADDGQLLELYKQFYRKLLYRNSNLTKPNIFTTNYDLYSERALDALGIHYINGFSGGLNKFFNPTTFNYAYAEKMDLSQNKWSVIDNFIYLYKIHGSVNWIEDNTNESKLFSIKEIQDPTFARLKGEGTFMIYPSPKKQNASLGSPYSDLFREFQKRIMVNNTVLLTIGYSFSDEHINNIIYQSFTIPSFRIIIFGDKEIPSLRKLIALNDPRIWIIGGKLASDKYLHFFSEITNELLPDLSNDEIDKKIELAVKNLIKTELSNEQR